MVAGPDQHYTSSTGPTTPYFNGAYVANSATSQWSGGSTFPASVPVDYEVHFTLTETFDAILSGSWAVDNQGLDILINGNSLGISLLGVVVQNFNQLHSFTTTAAQSPPSTRISVAVTYFASSEARNSAACATSQPSPI